MSTKRILAAGALLLAGVTSTAGMAAPAYAAAPTTSNSFSTYTAYTQGWYKNHPTQWPCGFPSDTTFFQSGQTTLEVLQASSKTSVYYALAQQTIAAYMNINNGAVPTPEVQQALQTAINFFMVATPDTQLTKEQETELKALIPILTAFNEGKTVVSYDGQLCSYQMARELKIRQ